MGIIKPKKRIELAHKRWVKEIEETTLKPKVNKKKNGKKAVKQGSQKDEIKTNNCLNYTMYINGNSVIIEVFPYLSSIGRKGEMYALPHIKRVIGVISDSSFERSSTINFPILAKSLGLTPKELLKRCKRFVEKHCDNYQVDPTYQKKFTSNGIVKIIKAS